MLRSKCDARKTKKTKRVQSEKGKIKVFIFSDGTGKRTKTRRLGANVMTASVVNVSGLLRKGV